MFTITLDPIIAHVGPFVLRWYSLILMTAIGVGVWLTAREAARNGVSGYLEKENQRIRS